MNLVLGTANLGQKYGISNTKQLSEAESIELLQVAYSLGFYHFDTAPDYGNSELLIRQSGLAKNSEIQIKVSKSSGVELENIKISINKSLSNLGIEKAHTILFHDPEIYNSSSFPQLVDDLRKLELSTEIGISCYSADEAQAAFSRCPSLTAFQIPENILDRRSKKNQSLHSLSELGCKIQVRSIFLQGLLLMEPEEIPVEIHASKPISKLSEFATKNGFTVLQMCISYATHLNFANSLVFGANSISQLQEIHSALNNPLDLDWDQFEVIPEPFIDPRNWTNK